jgi:hypothetical protein
MIIELVLNHLKDIALALLGVLGGGIVSLFFYRKALQRREISYATDVDRLIWSRGQAFSDIELLYKGRKLSDPRKAIYYVWNSGNCTINASEIAPADPLTIGANNIQILSVEIPLSTRDVIGAKLDLRSNSEALLNFYFLDPGDGVVIELFYDLNLKDKTLGRVPIVRGTLKGSPTPPVLRDLAFQSTFLNRAGQSVSLLAVLFLTVVLLVFQTFEIMSEARWLSIVPKALTGLLLVIVALGILIASISTWRAYRIPRALKSDRHDYRLPLSYADATELVERVNER